MHGETDLQTLLRAMQPQLASDPYVFCSLDTAAAAPLIERSIGMFRETEGVTLMLPQAVADQIGLRYDTTWALITITVHSSLNAIGFLAAISERLAKEGISLNVVSALYHDHLFVPWHARDRAIAVLASLSAGGIDR